MFNKLSDLANKFEKIAGIGFDMLAATRSRNYVS